MPLWLIVTLAGVVAATLGIAGVGNVLLWIGAGIIICGLLQALVSGYRRSRTSAHHAQRATEADHQRTAPEPEPGGADGTPPRQSNWQHRAARLGWITGGLATLSVALLGTASWMLVTGQPHAVPEARQGDVEAVLPVPVTFSGPRPAVVLGLGLGLCAFFVGMAALQAATAMRVLSRGRRITQPLPGNAARTARRTLGPIAVRSLDLERPPDWPVSALPEGSAGAAVTARCTVLIPAHDEEAVLAEALASLNRQTRPPDRVLVIADNCTDATATVARAHGVEVFETTGNTQHKAGALNQALSAQLASAEVHDVFVVLDADSTITPGFLATALGCLDEDPDLMAVGGLFSGEDGAGALGQLQRNEFARYQREIDRREGRVSVLTGTASVYRGFALRAVAQARGTLIPGTAGGVYDTLARTEDNELTLALKSLGARMTSRPECRVTTEVMPTWRDLWRQRSRWQRGAVENVAAYGFTRATARYWVQQLSLGYGVIALNAYLLLVTIALLGPGGVRWSSLWTGIGTIFVLERVVTAWRAGWFGRVIAAALIPEIAYSLYLQACFVTALVRIATGRRADWNYVPRQTLKVIALPVLAVAVWLADWSPLPSSALQSTWVQALRLLVAVNTVIFATRSVFQVLPPIRRSIHRWQRRRTTSP